MGAITQNTSLNLEPVPLFSNSTPEDPNFVYAEKIGKMVGMIQANESFEEIKNEFDKIESLENVNNQQLESDKEKINRLLRKPRYKLPASKTDGGIKRFVKRLFTSCSFCNYKAQEKSK